MTEDGVYRRYFVFGFLVAFFSIPLTHGSFSAAFKTMSCTSVWHLAGSPPNPEEKCLCVMCLS